MKVELDVIPDRGLCLNGTWFTRAVPPEDYAAVLRRPSRVDEGPQRAPVGHRNNHRHVYDELGITLLDHHATLQVEAVEVWYDPTFLPSGPGSPFEGGASINGVAIEPQMTTGDLVACSLLNQGLGQFAGGGTVCTLTVLTRHVGGTRHTDRQQWELRGFAVSFNECGRSAPPR